VTLAAHLDVDVLRERVHDRNANAVESAGHRVTAATELSPGVKDRHDDLYRRLLFLLVDVDRDTATVVDDAHAAILANGDADVVAIAGERFIDRVVDYLVDEVVETARPGGTDVHTGALAHCLKTLKDLDLICAVAVVWSVP
jgi:hypothetical protein